MAPATEDLPATTPVELRPATMADARLLFDWANDPTTRAASFRTDAIEWPGHVAWLADRLGSPDARLVIGYQGGLPLGQVRFELDADGTAEISVSVAPASRGRGVGVALVLAGIAMLRADAAFAARRFVARARLDNRASLALFARAGFRRLADGRCHGIACAVFELDA
jgi:RimJ/RimL family protein N-acetyltransferase